MTILVELVFKKKKEVINAQTKLRCAIIIRLFPTIILYQLYVEFLLLGLCDLFNVTVCY